MNQLKMSVAEFFSKYTKPALTVVAGVAIAYASFKLGAKYGNPEKKEVAENAYDHAFSPSEISIAVNESNELIMIERATGEYIVYSDTIGQTIFGMYANRIHQEVTNGK
jgi:hypothetical protein